MSEKRKWFGGVVIVVVIIFFAALWIRPNEAAVQKNITAAAQAAEDNTAAKDTATTATQAGKTGVASDAAPEEEIVWYTNYTAAQKKAKEENKKMFLLFHGSDWCYWCIKLDEEVLSKKEFLDWAKNNLILVSLDFPNNIKQEENLKTQNQILAQLFKIEGYPTVIIADASGKEIFRTGYQEGGVEKYIAHLEKALK